MELSSKTTAKQTLCNVNWSQLQNKNSPRGLALPGGLNKGLQLDTANQINRIATGPNPSNIVAQPTASAPPQLQVPQQFVKRHSNVVKS